MSKPVAFFMVVKRRFPLVRLWGWLLPKKVSTVLVTRKKRVPFEAKVGSLYDCNTRDIVLDDWFLRPLYRLYRFRTWSQARAYMVAQGLNVDKALQSQKRKGSDE
jgi:hypothetical protein